MRVSPSSFSEDQTLAFLLSAWSQKYWGCNFAYNAPMHATKSRQAQVTLVGSKTAQNQVKMWEWAGSSVLEAKRVQGDLWVATCAAFCFQKTEEEASSTIVWSRDQDDGSRQNIKRMSAILSCHGNGYRRACVHVSVWVTLFTISDLGRSFAARSRLITADQTWSPVVHNGPGRGRPTPFLKLIYLSVPADECRTIEFVFKYVLIPKTIGNRKRDCAWGCARGINTIWENLQIEKHKSVRWTERTPSWFVLFDLQILSGTGSSSSRSRSVYLR